MSGVGQKRKRLEEQKAIMLDPKELDPKKFTQDIENDDGLKALLNSWVEAEKALTAAKEDGSPPAMVACLNREVIITRTAFARGLTARAVQQLTVLEDTE